MPLCDTLMRAAEAGFYRIHYSQEILDGATRNLVNQGKMTQEKAARFQQHIIKAFPEGLVEVPENLIGIMTNHPGDRHVFAAAIAAKTEVIVTANLKHFRAEDLAPWGVEAQHPDVFLNNLCDLYGTNLLVRIIREQAEDCKRPPQTIIELLDKLGRQTPRFAGKILFYKYGKDIEKIARRTLAKIGSQSSEGSCSYEGRYYGLHLKSGFLSIIDKSGRGEILRSKAGKLEGELTSKDIERFQVFAEELEQVLANSAVDN